MSVCLKSAHEFACLWEEDSSLPQSTRLEVVRPPHTASTWSGLLSPSFTAFWPRASYSFLSVQTLCCPIFVHVGVSDRRLHPTSPRASSCLSPAALSWDALPPLVMTPQQIAPLPVLYLNSHFFHTISHFVVNYYLFFDHLLLWALNSMRIGLVCAAHYSYVLCIQPPCSAHSRSSIHIFSS